MFKASPLSGSWDCLHLQGPQCVELWGHVAAHERNLHSEEVSRKLLESHHDSFQDKIKAGLVISHLQCFWIDVNT